MKQLKIDLQNTIDLRLGAQQQDVDAMRRGGCWEAVQAFGPLVEKSSKAEAQALMVAAITAVSGELEAGRIKVPGDAALAKLLLLIGVSAGFVAADIWNAPPPKARSGPKPASVLGTLLEDAGAEHAKIAMRAAEFLGHKPMGAHLEPMGAHLEPVARELGGGWLVWAEGPCRGAVGFIAHIDESGWILRVAPYADLRWPGRETPVDVVMGRLIDDPVYPGRGLLQSN